jgi:hypothetical protein
VKHLGLSRAHGEVSSFGTLRLAFWKDAAVGTVGVTEEERYHENDDVLQYCKEEPEFTNYTMKQPPTNTASQNESSVSSTTVASSSQSTPVVVAAHPSSSSISSDFLPNLPPPPPPMSSMTTAGGGGSTPLTPFDQQGSLRSSTAATVRSPFVSYGQKQLTPKQPPPPPQQQQQQQPPPQQRTTPRVKNFATPTRNHTKSPATAAAAAVAASIPHPFPSLVPSNTNTPSSKSRAAAAAANNNTNPHSTMLLLPHHYAKEEFKSTVVPNDCNPVWGDTSKNNNNNLHDGNNNNQSNFQIPLQKDDLLPTFQTDGGRIGLEIRLDEEMAPTESLLVDGALSSAVNVASVATSMVGMGKQTKEVSNYGREMLGLGSDRLIGKGYVDLMPLLVGLWEDDWDVSSSSSSSDHHHHHSSNNHDNKLMEEEDTTLDVYGRIPPNARMRRRRVERMGLLDVWVPLNHPSDAMNSSTSAGKVHLLISYEPNGMPPKRDDVVALESFARRPFDQGNIISGGNASGRISNNNNNNNSSSNAGSVINPILPTLSPFLVIDMKGSYLLLEYATSRTVTSVDRLGNIKSSRWERTHRVRIHRNSVFVIERRTLLDVAGNIARLPGDIVMSTTVGQEIAEVSAPVVAGALELMTPAFMSAKLLLGAGGLGVRASMAGVKAASQAVVSASQQKAMERREGVYVDERGGSDSGVYRFG